MYVFISAVFFLFFLIAYKSVLTISVHANEKEKTAATILSELQKDKNEMDSTVKNTETPAWVKNRITNNLHQLNEDIALLQNDSTKKFQVMADMQSTSLFSSNNYTSKEEYDSIQNTLPDGLKDNWIRRKFQHKNIEIDDKFKSNSNEAINTLLESFFHHFPQTLFISLPLFALVLQLLYARRKQFYYASHIIYTVHLYCALYVFLFLILLISRVSQVAYLHWLIWINVIVFLYLFWYTFRALHAYYGQGTGKTFLKWILLNTAAFFILLGLFVVMFFFTIFTM